MRPLYVTPTTKEEVIENWPERDGYFINHPEPLFITCDKLGNVDWDAARTKVLSYRELLRQNIRVI